MPNNERTNHRGFAEGAAVELSFSRSRNRHPKGGIEATGTGMGTAVAEEGSAADKGTEAAAPVVLLHGYCGSRQYWDAVVPLLSAEYDVIAPDLRGHGESPAPDQPVYTMEQLADDTAALLDRLGLSQAFVIGHSLGGYAALAFAERHPDRLLGFGLVHSTSLPDTDAGKEARLKAAEQIRAAGIRPFVDGLVPKLFAQEHQQRPDIARQIAQAKTIGYDTSPEGAIGCAMGMRERPDRTHVLQRTQLPVLLLAGERDEVIPPPRRFPVESRPNIVTALLPEAGHMSMMEDPAACARVLLDYLNGSGGNARV